MKHIDKINESVKITSEIKRRLYYTIMAIEKPSPARETSDMLMYLGDFIKLEKMLVSFLNSHLENEKN